MKAFRDKWFATAAAGALALWGCGKSSQGGGDDGGTGADASPMVDAGPGSSDAAPAPDAAVTGANPIQTVFVILMENHNWSDISTSSSATYIRQTLLPGAAHAEQYYNPPNLHPSEPNYKWLEAGDNFNSVTDNDPSASNHITTTSHLTTQLKDAGISWMSYQEGMTDGVCPLVSISATHYAAKHNPFVFFDDATGTRKASDPYCVAHNKPLTQLATDLGDRATTARYNFITPNLCNDMHDTCAPVSDDIKQGDNFLMKTVELIKQSPVYQDGHAAIFITWDESEGGDVPIGMIVVSPLAKPGYAAMGHYTHSSTLKTMQEIFGVTPLLGDAGAVATKDLSDLFTTF